MKYDFASVEKKWQDKWEETKPYAAITGDPRPKFYGLFEFPYPSAAGLHVGHPRPFTAMDIITRKKRMDGYNVIFPIGYDAFGLPTENFAIKNHIHPSIVTRDNIANFTRQLKMLGYGFDWDRCVNTSDPKYYKWTQWIFLQMFKHDLAYKTTMPINWCTSCKCGLANEEVVEGVCERCGSPVVRKEKSQWMLRITKYADRLIDDLDDLDFIERVKVQQKNWIGRSTGSAEELDRPLHRLRGHLQDQHPRRYHRLHHPRRYSLRRELCRHLTRASAAGQVACAYRQLGRGRRLPRSRLPQVRL